MNAFLSAHDIQIAYSADALPIIDGLHAQIMPGALTGVIGPNGSGKSTLVRALSRVLKPRTGAVTLASASGLPADLYADLSAREAARALGVVPQGASGTETAFSVRDIVGMGRAPHLPPRPFAVPTAHDEAYVTRALESADVAHLSERVASELSGGEWQRVLFARALAQDTDILLLDEPTAHLDLHHQTQILTLARHFAHKEGRAVLAVLHDLNLAAEFCDRLLLLKAGRVAADGPPEDVLTASQLFDVYGARVAVLPHPATGRPVIVSLPSVKTEDANPAPKVHIVCGAGTGRAVMMLLREKGWGVTAGALHVGDPDVQAAVLLGVPCALETAFAPLSSVVREETRILMTDAAALVVAPVPFGPANLANLNLSLEQAKGGRPVFCLGGPDFAGRDVSGGEASSLWASLLQAGAVPAADIDTLLRHLEPTWKHFSRTP